jgi:hypothetical protein
MPTKKPKSRAKKKEEPSCEPTSIWHEEAHPGLTHSIVAIGAFFAGVVILGAMAVNAETSSSPTVISQLNEIKVELGLLSQRVGIIEEQLDKKTESLAYLISNCDTLEEALPLIDGIRRVPSSIACFEAAGINRPDQKFLSVAALYQYMDEKNDTNEITVQIFDFGDNQGAIDDFLTKGAYLPTDYNLVNREDTLINGLIGVFTYEGLPFSNSRYVRGANWLVVNNRFGVLMHGSVIGLTDRDMLDTIAEAVDTEVLMNIQ